MKIFKGLKIEADEMLEFTKIEQIKNFIIEWCCSIVISMFIALFLTNYIIFLAIVPTGSMIPTIDINDRIIVCRMYRYFDKENRGLDYGDMVVFRAPDNDSNFEKNQLVVKRVIGLGGDKINIEAGVVYRNSEKLEEPYIKNKGISFMEEIIVPDGEIFVLGDNRADSYDSRFWKVQTFSLDRVEGEVINK